MAFVRLNYPEIQNLLPPRDLPLRADYYSKNLVRAFVKRRKMLLVISEAKPTIVELERIYKEKEVVPEPNRDDEWNEWMADCARNISRKTNELHESEEDLAIAIATIESIKEEIELIHQTHPDAFHYTRNILDVIMQNEKMPTAPIWN